MRIPHPLTALVIVAAVTSCSDATMPRLTRYELADIDGVPLPRTSIDEAGKSVVSGGAVYLSNDGGALRVEEFTRYPQNGVALSGSTREPRQYRITDDSIAIGDFAHCTPTCPADYVGTLADEELALRHGGQGPVYRYRRSSSF
jgi:hypothetical protein